MTSIQPERGGIAPSSGIAGPTLSRGRTRPGVVLTIAALGVFMAFVDDTVVAIAFPNMVRSFHGAHLSGLSWVLNAYNIALAALIVPAGRFADRFGRRRLYTGGLVIFTLSSAMCALAPSLGVLIAARGVQGAGAAAIVPASLALVLKGCPAQRRPQSVAIWSATAALAAGVGPSIGGGLVDIYNWRLVFLINLPIGLVAYLLSRSLLVESRAPGRRIPPDLGGALLLAGAVGMLTLAVVQGPGWGWSSPGVIVSAAASALAFGLLARRCLRHPAPVIDLELLKAPGFLATGTLTLIGAAGFFSLGVANVLFLIQAWRYSPLQAGLATTPAPFLAALTAGAAGQLAQRFDPRRLVLLGATVWTAGPLLLFARAGAHPSFLGVYLPAAAVLAVGIGFAFPLVGDAAVGAAPAGRYAGATALNGAIRQVGAAIGIAVLAALLGHSRNVAAVHLYRPAWLFAAGCFALVAAGSLALAPFKPPELGDEEELLRRRSRVSAAARGHLRRSPPAHPRARLEAAIADNDEALLAEVSMFATLPSAARSELAARARTVRLAGGEWLFHQGDQADALFVVRSGRVEVVHEDDGRPSEVLSELGRGSVVGELALLSRGVRSTSIRGRRDATLLRIDRPAFEALLEDAPAAAAVARTLGQQLQQSRLLVTAPPSGASTLAIVRRAGDPRAAVLEAELLRSLRSLCKALSFTREEISDLAPDADLGTTLARVLDRVERDHDLVVLRAAGSAADDWRESALRQADRTLLILDQAGATGWMASAARLSGCDAVLLDPSDSPPIAELLDALAPRSTHRVRGAEDIWRLARRLAGHAVGLVLSGGGARAFAHVGVIEELHAAGVTIDRVGGASMGAFIGALLAQGLTPEEIEERCYVEFVRRNPLGDYGLPRASLIRGSRARAMIERNLPGRIEDLVHPYFCVSTDIIASELVVHQRGLLAPAVGASMSLPGVLPPVPLGQRLLVDGGVLDNLPITTMAAQNEGPIIASDVTEPEQRLLAAGEEPPEIGLIDTLARVMCLGTSDTELLGRRHAELLITPDHELVGRLEFHMLDRMRDAGRRAALDALEQAPARLFGR